MPSLLAWPHPPDETFDEQANNKFPQLRDVTLDDYLDVGDSPEIVFSDVDLLATDSDPDGDELSIIAIESQPTNGQLLWNQGVFTYIPNTGFTGSDSFGYEITDGRYYDKANVFLTVNAAAAAWGWLRAWRPLNEPLKWRFVPPEEAEEIGVFIRRNGDDDNSANGPDASENTGAGVANENDLIYVDMFLSHPLSTLRAAGFPVQLKRSSGDINVWANKNKTGGVLVGNDVVEVIPPPDGKHLGFWVEWVSPGAGPSTLELWVGAGKVHDLVFHPFTSVVIGFVGESQVAGDMKNGMTQIIDKLYDSAYDAHIYDEDDPQFDKDFLAEELDIDFDFGVGDAPKVTLKEVRSAVTERGVTKVSVMGYSHGGGATYVLADQIAVDETLASATYAIPFTAYIDAVKKRSALAESRPPTGSDAHYNVWQHRVGIAPFGIQFIQGTSVPGSFVNDDVDSEGGPFFYRWPGKMHINVLKRGIAEAKEVQQDLITKFKESVPGR